MALKLTLRIKLNGQDWTENLYVDGAVGDPNAFRQNIKALVQARRACMYEGSSLFAVRVTDTQPPYQSRYFTRDVDAGQGIIKTTSDDKGVPWLMLCIRQRTDDRKYERIYRLRGIPEFEWDFQPTRPSSARPLTGAFGAAVKQYLRMISNQAPEAFPRPLGAFLIRSRSKADADRDPVRIEGLGVDIATGKFWAIVPGPGFDAEVRDLVGVHGALGEGTKGLNGIGRVKSVGAGPTFVITRKKIETATPPKQLNAIFYHVRIVYNAISAYQIESWRKHDAGKSGSGTRGRRRAKR